VHYREIPHPERVCTVIETSRFRLSDAPACDVCTTPLGGADNQYVLQEVLGYGDDRITELILAGALE
jgi:crotonobetainyl-CoA:carnitine CoA-transferase CaiB-like acyl-CoA transferase